MKNPERMNFLNSNREVTPNIPDGQELSKENRLKAMSMSKVSGITEFDRLFNTAVEKQQKEKKERESLKERRASKADVVKDDLFADLDAELGF